MDLLEYMNEKNKEKESPLASRLRPRTLDEVVGQEQDLSQSIIICHKMHLAATDLSWITQFSSPAFTAAE